VSQELRSTGLNDNYIISSHTHFQVLFITVHVHVHDMPTIGCVTVTRENLIATLYWSTGTCYITHGGAVY